MNNFKDTALYRSIMDLFSMMLDAVKEMDEPIRETIGFRMIDDVVDLALAERKINDGENETSVSPEYVRELYLLVDMLEKSGYKSHSDKIVQYLGNVDNEIVKKNIKPKSVLCL